MGIYTYTTTVPYKVAPLKWEGDIDQLTFCPPLMQSLCHAIRWIEIKDDEDYQDCIPDDGDFSKLSEEDLRDWEVEGFDVTYYDWSHSGWKPIDYVSYGGKSDTVVALKIIKDGFEPVYMINESRNSMVGYYEISFASDNKVALEQFCKDWDISEKIEENVAAQYTS